MKKNYLLFLLLFVAFQLQAQDYVPVDVPPLLITEWTGAGNQDYLELTNVGTEDIVLDSFSIHRIWWNTPMRNLKPDSGIVEAFGNWSTGYKWQLEGILAPGESWVAMSVQDRHPEDGTGLPLHNVAMLGKADLVFHAREREPELFLNKPEWEAYNFDTIQPGWEDYDGWYDPIGCDHNDAILLNFTFTDPESGLKDSLYVDQVNLSYDPDYPYQDGFRQGWNNTPVAGMADVLEDHVFVRKANVTQGNFDWHLARGTDMVTSEWIPIPYSNSRLDVFTTVGVHGDYSLDYTVNHPEVSLDGGTNTLTVPWRIVRGDSLSHLFDLGPGMSWSYTENPADAADSAYYSVQNGDVFTLYAVGNDLERVDMTINVTPATASDAIAYPKRRIIVNEETGESYWPGGYLYGVTQGLDMDSIFRIPYGTRADTLFKYLDKPGNATWEIEYLGGEVRADVKEGDILKVTSQDGTVTKEYVIMVDDYEPGSNSRLSMISWPDVDLDTYWTWTRADTLPDFGPNKLNYMLKLKEGTTAIPALQFKTEDVNARMEIERATDINGSISQRTTTVTVVAEDDSTVSTYLVVFQIETVPVQPNFAEPIFSEFMYGWGFNGMGLEIANPGNQDLDLSHYMLVRGASADNLLQAVSTLVASPDSAGLNKIYKTHFVPSKRWKGDTDIALWQAEPGYLVDDNVVDPILKAGDVFVMGNQNTTLRWNADGTPNRQSDEMEAEYDFFFTGEEDKDGDLLNAWGLNLHARNTPTFHQPKPGTNNNSYFLLKIMNDSVRDGLKPVTDPDDYMIVDRHQKDLAADKFYVSGRDLNDPKPNGWSLIRKPDVWRGVDEPAEGFGDNGGQSAENSEWDVLNYRDPGSGIGGQEINRGIGFHILDPITAHLSTVTSVKMEVTPGYEGALTITGDLSGLTVTQLLAKLDKGDPDQTLHVINGADTLSAEDAVAADMVLSVISVDEKNTSDYTLVNSPLSADNLLVAVDGSGLTVALEGAEGTVAGVVEGSTIASLLDNLTVPAEAVLNLIDSDEAPVSLKTMNFDSVVVDATVSPDLFLEVVAQNGDAAVYSLDFGYGASDAVLLSDVFAIDQAFKVVKEVPEGITVSAIFGLVYPNEKASIRVVDHLGYPRMLGHLYFDDMIEVTSEDQSVVVLYHLNFLNAPNFAPLVSVVGPTEAVTGTAISYSGSAVDDGLPSGSTLSYQWAITSGDAGTVTISAPDQITTDVTFTAAGTFELTLTASDGDLSAEVSSTITVTDATGISMSDISAINVYPNPASDRLFVDFGNLNEAGARVRIIDMVGSVAYDETHFSDVSEIGLDKLREGMYFIHISIEGESRVLKLNILK